MSGLRIHGGRQVAVLCGVASCLLAGCTKQGYLPTAQVTGRVMFRGAPLAQGEIKFFPEHPPGEGVRVAYGILDAQGHYRLGTYRQGDGAILGDHRIAVEFHGQVPDGFGKGGDLAQRPKMLIPERFGDPATSGLTAHVQAGTNTFDFDLKE